MFKKLRRKEKAIEPITNSNIDVNIDSIKIKTWNGVISGCDVELYLKDTKSDDNLIGEYYYEDDELNWVRQKIVIPKTKWNNFKRDLYYYCKLDNPDTEWLEEYTTDWIMYDDQSYEITIKMKDGRTIIIHGGIEARGTQIVFSLLLKHFEIIYLYVPEPMRCGPAEKVILENKAFESPVKFYDFENTADFLKAVQNYILLQESSFLKDLERDVSNNEDIEYAWLYIQNYFISNQTKENKDLYDKNDFR